MAYCPKCGVELEKNRVECPLCNCKIPKIDNDEGDHAYDNVTSLTFPKPENLFPAKLIDIRKKTFYAVSIFILINVLLYIGILFLRDSFGIGNGFVLGIIVSIWIYLTVFLGMIKNRKAAIILFIVNTFVFTFLVDIMINGLGWFIPVFVPSTILFSILLVLMTVYVRVRKKTTVNIMFPVTISISTFLIGFEAIVSRWLNDQVVLTWSVFLSIEIIGLCLLLLFFYHRIPAKTVSKLRKKLHT
jgi:hypothetical protein